MSLPTVAILVPSGEYLAQFANFVCSLKACLNLKGGPSNVLTCMSSDAVTIWKGRVCLKSHDRIFFP
jgi:hypothetical protein